MGILESAANNVLGFGGETVKQRGQDFPEGLVIVEIIDGKEQDPDKITLLGSFLPHIPFEFGGTQQIVKEYYAGSSEPTVQVLGPRESDTTIKGKLNTKTFKRRLVDNNDIVDLTIAAREFQELMDAMRIRGNMVKITLGEWKRYGFIEKTMFKMNRLAEIEYEISFSIIGFNPPKNCILTDGSDDDLIKPNKDITDVTVGLLDYAQNKGIDAPQSIFDFINDKIGDIAEVVNVVTSFVDGIISDAQALQASANRAIGMIKYARSYISKTKRQIGSLALDASNLGSSFSSEAAKTAATIKTADYIQKVQKNNTSLLAFLAALQLKFAALAKTTPKFRHLVKEGDTLQRLSIKYFNSADNWKSIYDHNKLSTTNLTVGSVLEIPKL